MVKVELLKRTLLEKDSIIGNIIRWIEEQT